MPKRSIPGASEKGLTVFTLKTMYYDSVMGIGDVSEALSRSWISLSPTVEIPGRYFNEGLKPQTPENGGVINTFMFLVPPLSLCGFGMGSLWTMETDGHLFYPINQKLIVFETKSVPIIIKKILNGRLLPQPEPLT